MNEFEKKMASAGLSVSEENIDGTQVPLDDSDDIDGASDISTTDSLGEDEDPDDVTNVNSDLDENPISGDSDVDGISSVGVSETTTSAADTPDPSIAPIENDNAALTVGGGDDVSETDVDDDDDDEDTDLGADVGGDPEDTDENDEIDTTESYNDIFNTNENNENNTGEFI